MLLRFLLLGVCLRFNRFSAGRPGVRTRVLPSEKDGKYTIWDERSEDTLANSRWLAVSFVEAAKEWQRSLIQTKKRVVLCVIRERTTCMGTKRDQTLVPGLHSTPACKSTIAPFDVIGYEIVSQNLIRMRIGCLRVCV